MKFVTYKAFCEAQIPLKAIRIWTAVAERSGDTAFARLPISKLFIHSSGDHDFVLRR